MVNGLRFEDRLEGATNFVSWKLRLMMTLREQELDTFVENTISIPDDEDEKMSNNKAMKIIVDAVKII